MPADTPLNIAVLISIGQHPVSGRARRADQDARAVELGLDLAGDALSLIHAGDAGQPALRQYLGMGLDKLTVLEQAPEADALPALAQHLADLQPDMVLCGVRAERGEASGLLPYLLAEQLGWPLVPRIAQIQSVDSGRAQILQALPRGQRRALSVPLHFIATVDSAAADARQYAFGPGRRGQLETRPGAAQIDVARSEWTESPAKPRPKRLNVVKAKSAADRFKAATAKPQGQGGRVLQRESSGEKARAILDLLIAEGVIRQ
ncbi:electron transfer flavoprotein subunit beta [Microbulbifer sp.]|uniref:electron transfer flavoprotein subunit beta n=1 Tax=Microbulbifer sp. TaxID=1908541 RepID=UPI003F31D34E